MKTSTISNCPISGESGKIRFSGCVDSFFSTPGEWQYLENPRTGHLWLSEIPKDDEVYKLYQNYYTHSYDQKSQLLASVDRYVAGKLGYNDDIKPRIRESALMLLPSVIAASKLEYLGIPSNSYQKLLDFGCGSGSLALRFKIEGKTVIGYDPDAKAVEVARQQGLTAYDSMKKIENLNIKFDLILLSHVIEHLADPVKEIQKLIPLLSHRGQIIITTPNSKSLGAKIFGKYWRGLEPPRHFNIFSRESFSDLASQLKLELDIKSTSRLARGIFYQSSLAALGYKQTEVERPKNFPLKILGYLYQIVEHLVVKINIQLGEELYVVLKRPEDAKP